MPSTSTIRRVLHAAGLVVPEPRKRPRSSWIRFEAAAPNEVWQSDFTHWRLADGSEVEIISWLDDHSRYLLGCTAFRRVAGDDVVATFTAAGDAHGWPAATLTDNGAVYTSRFTGGRNGFEYLLAYLGIRQKNGAPGHPQTQGKIERFHQTLKRWLGRQPAAPDLAELQAQLDTFRSSTTSSGRTGRSAGSRPARRTGRHPRPCPPASARRGHFRLRYDVDRRQRRHHPAPGRPAAPPQGRRRPRPPARPRHRRRAARSRSSPSTPARSSRPTASSPTAATGATNDETPADGRGPKRQLTLIRASVSPMSRLMCRPCRDSRQWRARRDSNPRPSDPKSDALSAELRARGGQYRIDGCIRASRWQASARR